LRESQDGIFSGLDFSTLSTGYASKQGIFHPDQAALKAKACRQWLRDRPEDHIAGIFVFDIIATDELTGSCLAQWLLQVDDWRE
jgi:hypothetical protein